MTSITRSLELPNGRKLTITEDATGGIIKVTERRTGGPGNYPYDADITDEYVSTPQTGGPGNYPWTPRRASLPPIPSDLSEQIENQRAAQVVREAPLHALPVVLGAARRFFSAQALTLTRQLMTAVEPSTRLIAMNVERRGDRLCPTNSDNSALDAARTTKGLAQLATAYARTPNAKADIVDALAARAAANWQATRQVLRVEHKGQVVPIHLRTVDNTQIGEQATNRTSQRRRGLSGVRFSGHGHPDASPRSARRHLQERSQK